MSILGHNAQAKDGHSLELQASALTRAWVVRVFSDVCSGKTKTHPTCDTLVVTKLDRIVLSLVQGIQLIEDLNSKGVTVEVLNIGMIDDILTGRLSRNTMLAFSEFEQGMLVDTMKECREAVRKKPGYRYGRPRKFTKS